MRYAEVYWRTVSARRALQFLVGIISMAVCSAGTEPGLLRVVLYGSLTTLLLWTLLPERQEYVALGLGSRVWRQHAVVRLLVGSIGLVTAAVAVSVWLAETWVYAIIIPGIAALYVIFVTTRSSIMEEVTASPSPLEGWDVEAGYWAGWRVAYEATSLFGGRVKSALIFVAAGVASVVIDFLFSLLGGGVPGSRFATPVLFVGGITWPLVLGLGPAFAAQVKKDLQRWVAFGGDRGSWWTAHVRWILWLCVGSGTAGLIIASYATTFIGSGEYRAHALMCALLVFLAPAPMIVLLWLAVSAKTSLMYALSVFPAALVFLLSWGYGQKYPFTQESIAGVGVWVILAFVILGWSYRHAGRLDVFTTRPAGSYHRYFGLSKT